jgi:hypothetical protein
VPGPIKPFLVAALVALYLVPVASATAASDAPRFKTCDALHKKFPKGVARDLSVLTDQVMDGFKLPASSPKAQRVYRANKHLDTDKDGVACEVPVPPMTAKIPLEIDAVAYSEYQGMDVTYLMSRACLFDDDVSGTCSSTLTDSAGTDVPVSGNFGDGLSSVPALTQGEEYTAIVKTSLPGHWHCSIYDPDGCSWMPKQKYTLRWVFTYENVDGQTVPKAEMIDL